jgi:hypothetical protein
LNLIGQARISIFSLQLSRQLGVAYNAAWMFHGKILLGMSEWNACDVLQGKLQMDDAYLAVNAQEAWQVVLRKTRCRSSLPSLCTQQGI